MKSDNARSDSQHAKLDRIKLQIATAVWTQFPPSEIRRRAIDNLERWKANGVWSLAYEEWMNILNSEDDEELKEALTGMSENANRLRQSAPYVGMLDKALVKAFNESEFAHISPTNS